MLAGLAALATEVAALDGHAGRCMANACQAVAEAARACQDGTSPPHPKG